MKKKLFDKKNIYIKKQLTFKKKVNYLYIPMSVVLCNMRIVFKGKLNNNFFQASSLRPCSNFPHLNAETLSEVSWQVSSLGAASVLHYRFVLQINFPVHNELKVNSKICCINVLVNMFIAAGAPDGFLPQRNYPSLSLFVSLSF